MNHLNLEEFERKIEYAFSDKSLLVLALTHSSYANEMKKGNHENNERLEFLGDAVLDMIISEYMYRCFPQMPEGELTKLRAAVVCESSLAELSRKLGLGRCILLGKGEESTGGRNRDSILADAFEAIIGAVCIDGGIGAANRYVMRLTEEQIERTKSNFRNLDGKTHLQEVVQKISKIPLQYKIVDEQGPDHNKLFIAEVTHDGRVLGAGSGRSKKEAEQNAANNALEHMNG
ncbi:MAG: ribonuclease III [Clostridia bacterium]|nr:ribonuclease III [Anaerotignum sp.]NCC16865.1 ribonuclease III [Clostridia bacterium]